VVKESSDSCVELEQAAESVATANGTALRWHVWRREEEKIALTLVVPFTMMFGDGGDLPTHRAAESLGLVCLAEACHRAQR
jgi:hypothetical protein